MRIASGGRRARAGARYETAARPRNKVEVLSSEVSMDSCHQPRGNPELHRQGKVAKEVPTN